MIDAPVIDLISLVEQRSGVRMREAARHWQHGPEHWGMCPFCGAGDNRFHIWGQSMRGPRSAPGHYWCRVCGKSGDSIQFIREFEHKGYVEACLELGVDPDDKSPTQAHKTTSKDAIPSDLWQDRARDLIHTAQKCLWSPTGAQALAYLHQRGFTDETIRQYELGYIPAGNDGLWLEDSPAQWGLSPDECKDGVVKLPRGILIPWRMSSDVWKLEVRLYPEPKKEGAKKLPSIKGSRDCLYNINAFQAGKPVVLCESALDALSGVQACGDMVTFVATGGSKQAQQPVWVKCLKQAHCVLIAFDNDDPGEEGTQYWLDNLSNTARAYPWAHDINDMLKSKLDIRDWLTNELEAYELSQRPAPEPQPWQGAGITPITYTPVVTAEHRRIEKAVFERALQLHKIGVLPLGWKGEELSRPLSLNVWTFITEHKDDLIVALNQLEQAKSFYAQFCAQPGYHLRLRDDGLIGIGVPEAVSDEQFASIEEQVQALENGLRHVLQDIRPGTDTTPPRLYRACNRCGHVDEWIQIPLGTDRRKIWVCSCYDWWYERPEWRCPPQTTKLQQRRSWDDVRKAELQKKAM